MRKLAVVAAIIGINSAEPALADMSAEIGVRAGGRLGNVGQVREAAGSVQVNDKAVKVQAGQATTTFTPIGPVGTAVSGGISLPLPKF